MRFAHTSITSRDYKKLADFYIEVFGCSVKPPGRNISGEWLNRGTGLVNADLEGVHLLMPGHGDDGPTLEIFTYSEIEEADAFMPNRTGYTHMAFEVDDVHEVYDKAVAHGGGVLGEIAEHEVEGVGMLTFVYIRDPEGNVLEIQSWV